MNVDERRWDESNIRVDTQRSAWDTWPEYAVGGVCDCCVSTIC